ncbi:hypothetical protein B0H21DRAFT_862196 [Amylocystis lapponica]|nr:hypothetical protein B0H21DRAFT_862196 [Amylocystis lapponica]
MEKAQPATWRIPPELRIIDDEDWEDMPIPERPQTPTLPASPAGRVPVRRRKPGTKAIYVAQPAPTRKYVPPKPSKAPPPAIDREQLQQAVHAGASFTGAYVLDIVATAFHLLRRPLGLVLFLYILAFIIGRLTTPSAPSPLCHAPAAPDAGRPQGPDFQRLMNVQGATFGQLLDESAGVKGLSLGMKKAEMATRDLIIVVRNSELRSRDMLVESLGEFVQDGQKAGKDLAKFTAMMNGAVDSIVAVNDYAVKTIEEADNKTPSALSVIWPFASAPQTDEIIMQSFQRSMGIATQQIARLILQAEQIMYTLEKMEEQMVQLKGQLSLEDTSITGAKDELLAALWTKLGGNRRELRDYDNHIGLLRIMGTFRTHALAHVSVALQSLQSLSAELEELRDRVATPQLVGDGIPVEVYVRAIRSGVERLQDSKMRARERENEIIRRVLALDGVDAL